MTEQNLDAMLDIELDDLADLPEFICPPAGAYKLLAKEFRVDTTEEGALIIFLKFGLITIELANEADTPLEAGTEIEYRYDLSNEFSQGALKKVLSQYKEVLQATSLRQVKEVFTGTEATAVLTTRVAKQSAEQKANKEEVKKYSSIKTFTLY